MVYLLIFIVVSTSWFLPWWVFVIWAFLAGLKAKTQRQALSAGFLAVFLPWMALSYYWDAKAHGLISERLASMFSLPWDWLIIALPSGLMGVVSAGFMLAGFYLSQWRQARWRVLQAHTVEGPKSAKDNVPPKDERASDPLAIKTPKWQGQ